jgi:hypothetical protein
MMCQQVRLEHADGLRGADRSSVRRVLRKFVRRFVLIRFVQHFWLLEVCQTVREVSANGHFRADGPRVGCGRSVIVTP